MSVVEIRELFRSVRARPRMYLTKPDFDSCVAFVSGVDAGSDGSVLDGFREYLVLRLGGHSSLAFHSLVLLLTFDSVPTPPWTSEQDAVAVAGLFDLLDQFLTEIGKHGAQGRLAIHREHTFWQQSQSWYSPDLERFGHSPAGDLVCVPEAAQILGMSDSDVLELIYEDAIRVGRQGKDLLLRRDAVLAYKENRKPAN